MVSKNRAWFHRLGLNVSHIVCGAVHGVENNIFWACIRLCGESCDC